MYLVRKNELAVEPVRVAERKSRVGIGWVRLLWFQGGKARRRKQIRVVETLTIGANNRLMLVSCAGERFLVETGRFGGVKTIVRARPQGVEGRLGLVEARESL